VFFNIVLALAATLGNGLVIVTILKSQNLQTPSYLLITSLAFTDLLMGLIYYPFLVLIAVFLLQKNATTLCFFQKSTNSFFQFGSYICGMTFFMNALISIDRYLALSLRHRYRIYVTKKRVRIAIIIEWSSTFLVFAVINFLRADYLHLIMILFGVVIILSTAFFYIKSFVTLLSYISQIQAQPNSG